MRIGIAGTGRMGTAIARRLLEKGHQVAAWNRTIENAHDAREAGARWSPRLADLVNEHDIVISFLLDNAAIERVYLGPQGVLDGRAEGRLFVDMSTVSPATHSRIAAALARRDAGFIECPVSGSIPLAQSGSLVGFAGGDAADFARARPVLADLCRRVEHVGPLGAGARMKLAANLLLVVFWQALGESLSLAGPPRPGGARAVDLLGGSNIRAGGPRAPGGPNLPPMNGDSRRAPAAFDVR